MRTRFSFCPRANRAAGVTHMEVRLGEIAVAMNIQTYGEPTTKEVYVYTEDNDEMIDLERRLLRQNIIYNKSIAA